MKFRYRPNRTFTAMKRTNRLLLESEKGIHPMIEVTEADFFNSFQRLPTLTESVEEDTADITYDTVSVEPMKIQRRFSEMLRLHCQRVLKRDPPKHVTIHVKKSLVRELPSNGALVATSRSLRSKDLRTRSRGKLERNNPDGISQHRSYTICEKSVLSDHSAVTTCPSLENSTSELGRFVPTMSRLDSSNDSLIQPVSLSSSCLDNPSVSRLSCAPRTAQNPCHSQKHGLLENLYFSIPPSPSLPSSKLTKTVPALSPPASIRRCVSAESIRFSEIGEASKFIIPRRFISAPVASHEDSSSTPSMD